MAAISRRRRFIAVFVFLCMSCALFAWYTRTEDVIALNEVLITEHIIYPHTNHLQGRRVEYANPNKKHSVHVDSSGSEKLHRKKPVEDSDLSDIDQEIEDNSNLDDSFLHKNSLKSIESHKMKFNTKVKSFRKSKSSETEVSSRQSITELESSGPTEYGKMESPTLSPRRQTVTEMESSGPTEAATTQLAATGPTEYNQVETTTPAGRTATDLPASGPTQFTSLSGTTPIPSYEQKKVDSHLTNEFGSTTPSGLQVTKHDDKAGLLLDTPGCKIPKLDPWDSTVVNLIELRTPLKCPGLPLFMKSRPDGSIHLNKTVLKKYYKLKADDLACTYQSFNRKYEEEGNVRENDYIVGDEVPLQFGVPLEKDYVAVRCPIESKTFEQYFPLVRLRKELEEERTQITPPTPRLNVILAGIDSVSKLNFLRHFPRTHKFLKEKIFPFEMKGYTKVGDNTFPNLVPLLTGHFVEHYWNESIRDTFYFDSLDLIWKDYAKKGYRTFYAEDSPFTGTFNYIKRGFYDPPTDYYFRPLALALEASNVRKNSKSHCLNSQIETDIIYDYLRDFVEGMDTRPYISFAMVSTLTHDYLNNAGLADEPAARLLEDLWNSGAFNNSALVLFSDHGLRFGAIRETYIGKFEERMPFMYIHFPKWFLDQNPEIAKNMLINQERLMTLFDIHATMMHLLDISRQVTPEEEAKYTQGNSLLNEISPNRTCEEANILAHWCPCQTFEVVPFDDPSAIKSSQAIVSDINSKLVQFGELCAVLEIEKVLDVRLAQANDLVLRFIRHDNVVLNRTVVLGDRIKPIGDYLVTLITKPGQAVFEATVRHDPNHDTYSVLGISRINMYGNQSRCIESQKMKIFCYCNS